MGSSSLDPAPDRLTKVTEGEKRNQRHGHEMRRFGEISTMGSPRSRPWSALVFAVRAGCDSYGGGIGSSHGRGGLCRHIHLDLVQQGLVLGLLPANHHVQLKRIRVV